MKFWKWKAVENLSSSKALQQSPGPLTRISAQSSKSIIEVSS